MVPHSRPKAPPPSALRRRFATLLRRVENLRVERERMAGRWRRFLTSYRERIHPAERWMAERRLQVIQLLMTHWRRPRGLGARQREQFAELLRGQLGELRDLAPDLLDAEALRLWEELNPSTPEPTPEQSSDSDSDFDPDRDPDTDPASDPAAERTGGKGGASDRAAGRGAASVGEGATAAIYKRLAKALHPDLEQDPALRSRKHELMQELTRAQREGDLHTLLRLEWEWLNGPGGVDGPAEPAEDRLAAYCEVLERQIERLRNEVREVVLQPGFVSMLRFANFESGGPADVESILLRIRGVGESLRRLRDALSGPEGREALRFVLREAGAGAHAGALSSGGDTAF